MTSHGACLPEWQEGLVLELAQSKSPNDAAFVCAFFVSADGILFARYHAAIPPGVLQPAARAFEKALSNSKKWGSTKDA